MVLKNSSMLPYDIVRPVKVRKKASFSCGVRRVFAFGCCKPFDEEPLMEVSAKAYKRGENEPVIKLRSVGKDGTVSIKKGALSKMLMADLDGAEAFLLCMVSNAVAPEIDATAMLHLKQHLRPEMFQRILEQKFGLPATELPAIEQIVYVNEANEKGSVPGLKNIYTHKGTYIEVCGTSFGKMEGYVVKTRLPNGDSMRREFIMGDSSKLFPKEEGINERPLSINEISLLLLTKMELNREIKEA
ncbi:MAG: hypothetical protein QXU54_01210 [Candidatus Micrarchaeia archaeon]